MDQNLANFNKNNYILIIFLVKCDKKKSTKCVYDPKKVLLWKLRKTWLPTFFQSLEIIVLLREDISQYHNFREDITIFPQFSGSDFLFLLFLGYYFSDISHFFCNYKKGFLKDYTKKNFSPKKIKFFIYLVKLKIFFFWWKKIYNFGDFFFGAKIVYFGVRSNTIPFFGWKNQKSLLLGKHLTFTQNIEEKKKNIFCLSFHTKMYLDAHFCNSIQILRVDVSNCVFLSPLSSVEKISFFYLFLFSGVES